MNLKDPHTQRIKRFPILMGVGISILVIVTAVLLVHATTASATPTDLSVLEIQYPAIVGSKIDSCAACHTSSIPNLNSFGYAYKLNGRNASALVAIQSLDSDGDGITNLQEFKALTFPGAANIAPQAVTPTVPGYPGPVSPTTPGYPPPGNPTASPTPLPTLTSTRTTAPTQTPTATRVPSSTPVATQAPSNTPAATRAPSNTPAATRASSNTPTSTQVSTHVPTSTQVVSKTPLPTRAVSMTPTRRVTAERQPTRAPRPTQTSVCPTPRGGDASSGAASSEADRLRCGHGGEGGHTPGDWLINWWNAFLAKFRPHP
jgi:hypothetical protein